jgi:FkbM family methyltransferase
MTIKDTAYGRFHITQESLSHHMADQPFDYMWEDHLKPAFDQYATGKVVVEVGASAGWHTVYLSRIAKTVVAFEPQTPQFNTLRDNLLLNECANVYINNKAVYSCARRMSLNSPVMYHLDNHSACAMHLKTDESGDIEAVTIDSLELDELGLIKIDAQGSDLHVMRGAAATIARCQPAILFEFDKDLATSHLTTYQDHLDFVESIGYRYERLLERDFLAVPR